MALDYGRLESIHYLLKRRADLSEQINRCPRVIKVAENAVATFEKNVEEAKVNWQTCKKEIDSKQLTMNQRESRIADLNSRRNAASSNKEYQLLNEQIAADEQANSVLADEILEMLERADRLTEQVQLAKSNLEKSLAEAAKIRSESHEKQRKLEAELAEVTHSLENQERYLAGDFLNEYRRRVNANGETALSETDGKTCGNCHQTLNTQTLSELYQRLAVFCKSCGCILYISPREMANRTE